jgi:hypothetical protein
VTAERRGLPRSLAAGNAGAENGGVGLLAGWAVVGLTQQYLVGEASVLLARLQASGTDPVAMGELSRLCREAEAGPVSRLGCVAQRALELTDELCRDSLRRGDVLAFVRQCACGAELREFCLCAQLGDV